MGKYKNSKRETTFDFTLTDANVSFWSVLQLCIHSLGVVRLFVLNKKVHRLNIHASDYQRFESYINKFLIKIKYNWATKKCCGRSNQWFISVQVWLWLMRNSFTACFIIINACTQLTREKLNKHIVVDFYMNRAWVVYLHLCIALHK